MMPKTVNALFESSAQDMSLKFRIPVRYLVKKKHCSQILLISNQVSGTSLWS